MFLKNWIDIEDIDTLGLPSANVSSNRQNDATHIEGNTAINGDVSTTLGYDERNTLIQRCRAAEERARQAESALQNAMEDIATMR